MRHRVQKRYFGRDTNHRKALLMNLVRSLMEKGSIVTTKAKAKEVKRLTDKYLGIALKGDIAARRRLHRIFGKRDVVNVMVDRVIPAMKDRKSGFTTLSAVGKRRGDNAQLAKLELIEKPENLGTLKSGQKLPKRKEKTNAKAAKGSAKTAKKVNKSESQTKVSTKAKAETKAKVKNETKAKNKIEAKSETKKTTKKTRKTSKKAATSKSSTK